MAVTGRLFFCPLLLCFFYTLFPRSIHRPPDPCIPKITTFWTDEPNGHHYTLQNRCLRQWALFDIYDPTEFQKNMVPKTLSYRNEPEKSVSSALLGELLEQFLQELLSIHKRKNDNFENFTILKDSNYNYKLRSGLIIIKFNDYPFVVKLFFENPCSFVQPFAKGFEPCWFFLMGGGINRYLSGFTRIKNLHKLKEIISKDPFWADRITFPCKWYWLPKKSREFTVTGYNLGCKTVQSQNYPSLYGIICDEISFERQAHNYHKKDRRAIRTIMSIVGNRLDPHIHNFFIEKNTGKIAIIDTELFSAIVGSHNHLEYRRNTLWYFQLANKCSIDCYFRTKKEHRLMQYSHKRPQFL